VRFDGRTGPSSSSAITERTAVEPFETPRWSILGGEDFDAHAGTVGGYGQMRWTLGRVTLTPGTRVDWSGLVDRWVASPWLQADWQVPARLTLVFNAGLHHQFPEFAQVVGTRGQAGLSPERALHLDAGVEGQLGTAARWQVSAYDREERDVLDLPDADYRYEGSLVQPPSATSLYENRLKGWSRGIELMVQRKSPDRLSGWLAYSFGHTRYTDRVTGERFDGDFDQRHTVSLFGRYRISDRMSANARFRYGSNRPLLGYYERQSEGQFVVGTSRNTVRVPAYARLDVRADRTYRWGARRLTLFGEVTNLLARENQRQIPPFVSTRTGQVFGLLHTMFPLIPSVGVTVEF
jgi:outer membrane receptor for ferrienterochelin and colicin